MNEAAVLRQKADTCIRLAEAASSARANELFKRLADEYRAKADDMETPMVSPPTAPLAVADSAVASVASHALRSSTEPVVEGDHIEVDHIETGSIVPPCLSAMPDVTPLQAPQANSAQWLAELQALRSRL